VLQVSYILHTHTLLIRNDNNNNTNNNDNDNIIFYYARVVKTPCITTIIYRVTKIDTAPQVLLFIVVIRLFTVA